MAYVHASFSKELFRLATYTSWPSKSGISPLALAKSGFFYNGKNDEVECFQCKTRISGWADDDNPQQKHRQMAPHCQVSNDDCTDNLLANISLPIPIKAAFATKRQTVADGANNLNDKLQPHDETSELDSILYQALSRAERNGVDLNNKGCTIDRTQPDFGILQSETERKRTFYDWPPNANADPIALAQAGFFYTGTDDRVRCFTCKGFIRSWEPSDVPISEHRRHFPDCSFASHLNSSNVNEDNHVVDRSGQSAVQQHQTGIDSSLVDSQRLIAERAVAVDRAAPTPEQLTSSAGDPPKFPAFKDYNARLESFRRGIVGQGQTAESLADAGWFHVGPNDKVRCFQCGGNLRDWEEGDDPWVEHKRWYDYCPYTKTHRPQPRPRVPEISVMMIPPTIGSYRFEPREVKARMDTPTVRAILDMGYSRDKVKTVIETRLSTTGDDFPNAESLLEALFGLDEAMTAMSAGATASNFASEDGNNSVYSNISTAASTISRSSGSSGYSTASSSASAVLLQPDLTSLPPTNSANDSAMSVQSKASASKDRKSVSLKPESAAVATAPDAAQSKTKAKKKRIRKKKPCSSAAASAANGDEDVATEDTLEAQNDPEKMNVDEEEANAEGNFEEIPDEEAIKWLEENRQLREQRTCKVCMDAEVNTVFLPCGHLVCCATCSPHLRNCPICRTFIRGTVKTFLS